MITFGFPFLMTALLDLHSGHLGFLSFITFYPYRYPTLSILAHVFCSVNSKSNYFQLLSKNNWATLKFALQELSSSLRKPVKETVLLHVQRHKVKASRGLD